MLSLIKNYMITNLQITGMHCGSCKSLIESVCGEIKGVQSCKVDYTTGRAVVTHDENLFVSDLIKEIESLGEYRVQIV